MKSLNPEILREKIENTINDDIANGRVGAAAVCVCQDGKELYRGFFADSSAGFEVKENTVFRLASMTKPITAVAVLILVDRGLIALDDRVSKYIKGFQEIYIGKLENDHAVADKRSETPITVRHLLTHTSGLGSGPIGDKMSAKFPVTERKTLSQVVDYYTECLLDFEPSSKQCYSGVFAFDVLARIVEIASGKAFSDFLAEELFEPLGMKNTTFSPTEEQWSRMIPMHNRADGKNIIADFPENSIFEGFSTTYTCGGAGLVSTLDDYLKFATMLLQHGYAGNRRIISEKAFQEMTRPQVSEAIMPGAERWGLSVRVITSESYGALPVGAFGWSGAYGTHFWVDPKNRITAVYLKNSRYDGGSGALTARILEENVSSALN